MFVNRPTVSLSHSHDHMVLPKHAFLTHCCVGANAIRGSIKCRVAQYGWHQIIQFVQCKYDKICIAAFSGRFRGAYFCYVGKVQ